MTVTGQRLTFSDLAAAGKLVLATYAAQLEQQGVTVPGRRYVTPGSGAQGIVWDGEQLNVALQGIHQGQPGMAFGGTQNPAATVLFAQWAVVLLREIPILRPETSGRVRIPTVAQMDQSGQANLLDVTALTQAAVQIHASYGPEGGLGGARRMFSANIT